MNITKPVFRAEAVLDETGRGHVSIDSAEEISDVAVTDYVEALAVIVAAARRTVKGILERERVGREGTQRKQRTKL